MLVTRAAVVWLLVVGLAAASTSVHAAGATAGVPAPRAVTDCVPRAACPVAERGEVAGGQEVDVDRLPVDLERLHRGLRQSTVRVDRDGLNLRYVIEVFGQAPPLVAFTKEDNLRYGPVPYGAPTHQEMIDHVTPKEYRAPAADLGALIRWLAERGRQ